MSPTLRLQKAQHEYQQFIRDLSECHARDDAMGDPDTLIEPLVEIPPSEALNAFLASHPEYNEFCKQLLDDRHEQEKFCFNEDRWQKRVAANSA